MVLQPNYEYDVCLSFASEQVSYVEQVYQNLCALSISTFFDRDSDIDAELWGSNLLEVFDKIYKTISQYCVMFISKEYAEKAWTKFERRSALERAFQKDEVYILPVRFDNTELPGIHNATKYVNAQEKNPKELAFLIAKKLGKLNTSLSKNGIKDTIKQLADELRSIFSEYYCQYVVRTDSYGRILIFRNKLHEKQNIFSAIIEQSSNNLDCLNLFNFGIFPPLDIVTQLNMNQLLQLFRNSLKNEQDTI